MIAFLGLHGWFPTAENRYALIISLPEEKRKARAALLADYTDRRSISHHELGKLIDRLSFPRHSFSGNLRERNSGRCTRICTDEYTSIALLRTN